MPSSKIHASEKRRPASKPLGRLSDEALFDLVQRQTFGFFWEGAHAASGLAFDRIRLSPGPAD